MDNCALCYKPVDPRAVVCSSCHATKEFIIGPLEKLVRVIFSFCFVIMLFFLLALFGNRADEALPIFLSLALASGVSFALIMLLRPAVRSHRWVKKL